MRTEGGAVKRLFARAAGFGRNNKGICVVIALLFFVRMCAMLQLGVTYTLDSDDMAYINSGLRFAETGVISMHSAEPSAQIMPGMTVFIGLLSFVFGQGRFLWLALKLIWAAMGSLCAWYLYRGVTLFAPKWCGIAACLPLFRPDYLWMDNVILTETPFLLCLLAMVYYTLKMGQDKGGYRSFWPCLAAYFCGIMLKANIALYPLFALVYLLIVKYDRKVLWKQCVILAGAVLCFVIPWSIRNYSHFDAFIPLTYGTGNPALLGTYQGTNYPPDESLDYETNVDDVVREKYARYYDENGEVAGKYQKYISLERDGVKAAYRQKVWRETSLTGYLTSYAITKPNMMIYSIFYWDELFGIPAEKLADLPTLEVCACLLAILASLLLKKYRAPVIFLSAVYLGNIYIYAMTYAFSRYNASLVYLRYLVIGIGLSLTIQLIGKGAAAVREFEAGRRETSSSRP